MNMNIVKVTIPNQISKQKENYKTTLNGFAQNQFTFDIGERYQISNSEKYQNLRRDHKSSGDSISINLFTN